MKSGRSPPVLLQMITCKVTCTFYSRICRLGLRATCLQRGPAVFGPPRYLIGFVAFIFKFRGYAGILDRLEFLERYTCAYDPRWERPHDAASLSHIPAQQELFAS